MAAMAANEAMDERARVERNTAYVRTLREQKAEMAGRGEVDETPETALVTRAELAQPTRTSRGRARKRRP